jgi:hypothetical protein
LSPGPQYSSMTVQRMSHGLLVPYFPKGDVHD